MKTFTIQIQYRTLAGDLEDPWIEFTATSKAAAKQAALTEATQKSNGKGAYVRQIKLT